MIRNKNKDILFVTSLDNNLLSSGSNEVSPYIKYKLNILLYKYPTKYLNFIRNVEQRKYKHRENYS